MPFPALPRHARSGLPSPLHTHRPQQPSHTRRHPRLQGRHGLGQAPPCPPPPPRCTPATCAPFSPTHHPPHRSAVPKSPRVTRYPLPSACAGAVRRLRRRTMVANDLGRRRRRRAREQRATGNSEEVGRRDRARRAPTSRCCSGPRLAICQSCERSLKPTAPRVGMGSEPNPLTLSPPMTLSQPGGVRCSARTAEGVQSSGY